MIGLGAGDFARPKAQMELLLFCEFSQAFVQCTPDYLYDAGNLIIRFRDRAQYN